MNEENTRPLCPACNKPVLAATHYSAMHGYVLVHEYKMYRGAKVTFNEGQGCFVHTDKLIKAGWIEERPAVENYGYANGWKDTPGRVKICKKLLHRPKERTIQPFVHEVRCDACGYVYCYDSSG